MTRWSSQPLTGKRAKKLHTPDAVLRKRIVVLERYCEAVVMLTVRLATTALWRQVVDAILRRCV